MKKILIISTGGTLASCSAECGLAPGLGEGEILQRIAGLTEGFEVHTQELFQLDSSNIQPEQWSVLAERIYENRTAYDGIMVLHGTDTLAYTAAALSFALPGIEIPVVLTGSQVPIDNPIADAMENCRAALHMAASGCAGVYVAFNRKIILGTRASKVRTRSFDAFESIDYPYAGKINSGGLLVNRSLIIKKTEPCSLRNRFCPQVFLLKLYPGIFPDILDVLSDREIRGIYIEAFGIGGIPFIGRNLTDAIGRATAKGIVVAIGSQCLYEGSDFSVYEVGRRALEQGVIETGNMTSEAAVAKLMWALGQYDEPEAVRMVMRENLAGEMSRITEYFQT